MPTLSIIIVTYNSGEIVFQCLRSLPLGVGSLSAEVIVVDNKSQDGTPARIEAEFPDVQLIANPDNLGFANANNRGLAAATGDYLLLLNPDVVVEPEALARLVEYLQRNSQVGVAGPRVLDGKGDVALSAYGAYTPFSVLWQYLGFVRLYSYIGFGHYWKQLGTTQTPLEVDWIQACCILFRRDVYAQIGGLDDGLFMFAEEPDFCERARRAGWKIAFFPGAQVQHFESTTVSRYPLIRMRHYHISPLYYYSKRRNFVAVLLLKVGFIFELSAKYGVHALQYVFKPTEALKRRLEAYPTVLSEIWRYKFDEVEQ